MITMDLYEQKYKEAVEMARAAYYSPETPYVAKAWLLTMFPIIAENELKESEDEESKNWILDYLYDGLYKTDEQFRDEFKAAIAWLEKQKPVSITDEWIEDYWQHHKVINPYSYDKGEEIQFDHQGFVNFCKKYL